MMGTVRAVIFEDCGIWIAQGVDLDFAAQGRTLTQARERFQAMVAGQIMIDAQENRIPFAQIAAAPDEFRRKYDAGEPLAVEGFRVFT